MIDPMKMAKEDREAVFLDELADLSKKYGIVIGSCGCCESPWVLHRCDVGDWKHFGGYTQPDYRELGWEE